jgi:hypothetical protein
VATGWNPDASGFGYEVHTLAVSGQTVYVGCAFFSIAGEDRQGFAALDAATGLIAPPTG